MLFAGKKNAVIKVLYDFFCYFYGGDTSLMKKTVSVIHQA